MSFKPGENIGSYRVVEQLGSGGMATVFKAYHAALDRYVAIKVMHAAFRGDDNFLARFQREARVVARLEHPHIVPVYDFSEHGGSPYLVMRFVEGETLKARLERSKLARSEILDVVRPVAGALDYAHQQGVLHRDIKPSNIILTPDGGVFLTDFGLARMVQAGESSLTRDGMVGTPFYISPEQAIGQADLDARTDVYSLGVVLYELLTGQVPFRGDTPFAVIHDHIYTPLPMPSSIAPDLPPAVERVLLKALSKEREDRYESAGQLVAALEKALMGAEAARGAPAPAPIAVEPEPLVTMPEPVAAEAAPAPPAVSQAPAAQAEPRPGRRRLLPVALGGLAVLAVAILALVFLLTRDAGDESKPPKEPPPTRDELPKPPPLTEDELLEQGAQLGKIEVAIELLHSGEFEAAIELLREARNSFPEEPILRLTLGQALVAVDRWDEAVPEFKWLMERVPDMAEPYAYMAIHMAVNVGDLKEAQRLVTRARELNPESFEVHFASGVYYWKVGNYRQARLELERARLAVNMPPWMDHRLQFFLERVNEQDPERP